MQRLACGADLRRDNGSGERPYRQRDGRWRSRYTLPDGRQRAVYSRISARDCAAKRDAALRELSKGLLGDPRQLFGDYLERWLLDVAAGRLRVRSLERYSGVIHKHIVPALGQLELGRVTPQHIAAFYAEVSTRLSPASIQLLHAALHGALKQAVRWQLIARNPADGVDLPRRSAPSMRALSPDEARLLLEAAVGTPLEPLWVLAIATGMRQGELLGLVWRDIDWSARRLYVRHSLSRHGRRWWLGEPKTQGSRRAIELTAPTLELLRAHRLRQAEQLFAHGIRVTDESIVFADDAGAPLYGSHLTSRVFHPLLAEAGLPRIRFHDLRHTAATLMMAGGVNPKIVAEVLGHSGVAITLDRYSHSTPTMHAEAMAKLDAMLGR